MPIRSPSFFLPAALAISFLAGAQESSRQDSPGDLRLPNGRLQRDEMLKADHERNLEDAAALIKLAEDLKAELDKNTAQVLSVSSIKKTEEIEKLAKKIRSRMRR